MSARKQSVVLSPFAEADFEDILVYTRGRWGAEQADSYAAAIRAALEALATHAEIGHLREDLRSGLRSSLVEQHYVL